MPSLRPLLAAVALALFAGALHPLHAQAPEKGNYSVAILLFTDETGTVVNFGRQWTDRLFVGVELDLREASVEEEVTNPSLGVDTRVANSDFAIGPVARWYGSPLGPVVPFFRLRGLVGWGDRTFEQVGIQVYNDDITRLAASAGIGAEWFPMDQVSISGYTGLQVSHEVVERTFNSGESIKQTRFNSGTYRSALSISFYFR